MKVMITGARGMLGTTLCRTLASLDPVPVDREEFDLTDSAATMNAVAEAAPDVVLHAAAYTAVDQAETDGDAAYAVNALGSANLARACNQAGARMIAYSTDYVFDGTADRAYHEWDRTAPAGVYGASKWAGEEAIRQHCPNHLILRIAWLYGGKGPSFVHTMMRLGQEEGEPLRVVDDQRGNPTSTDAVAAHTELLLKHPIAGTMHLTCEGETTWYGFARRIFEQCGYKREIVACTSEEYPRPCRRPANSCLENRLLRLAGLPPMPAWQDGLSDFLKQQSV